MIDDKTWNKCKEIREEGGLEFSVRDGAFGFDKIDKVCIVPADMTGELKTELDEPIVTIGFMHKDKVLAVCGIERGERDVCPYVDGKPVIISGGEYPKPLIIKTDKDGNVITDPKEFNMTSYSDVFNRASVIAQSASRIWQNCLKGSYDKDFAQQKMVKDALRGMI